MFHPKLAFKSPEKQAAHQSDALNTLVARLSAHSPFYKKRFRTHHVNTEISYSLKNIAALPTTTKNDLQQANFDFLCTPRSAVKEYTATSGTLGAPVTIALTENDLQRLAYNEHQSFLTAGGSPADSYQLMLTLDRQFMAGMAYYSGIRRMGAALVRTGPGLPQMQWEALERTGSTALVTVPSFLLQMIHWGEAHGKDLSKTAVEKVVCIGEGIRTEDFSLNALGQKIAAAWPLKLYSTYAATELQTAFTECSAGRGGHLQPDLIIVEILDDGGRPLPDGEAGEVTITTLGVEGMPLLRYRTGDIAALHPEPCSCGRLSKRLGPIIGRKQQMIKYRGTTLYPPAIYNLLNEQDYIESYVVEALKDALGLDSLKLHIHTPLTADECDARLRPVLQARLRVAPPLHFHSRADMQAMQLPEGSRKAVRFIDNR